MNPLHAPTAAFLMVGSVMHERLRPTPHRFVYPLFCVRLNLARLSTLNRWWFGINRWSALGLSTRDYGACDGSDLEQWMRQRLADADIPAYGEIWLQTMPRVFGYAFNPVSFWFCHDRDGQLRALLAEVRNTFGDRHSYLLTADDGGPIGSDTRLQCRKTLHVSPFCKVEGRYEFRVRQHDAHASVAIDYFDAEGLLIRTAIGAKMAPLTGQRALHALVRQPLLTVSVVVRIHWQALRLLFKKVPFYGKHPHVIQTGLVAPSARPSTPSNKETRP
jgi:uncharacterized protein